MTKRERIQAAVKGTKPDKLPYSLWTHLPGIDLDPALLAEKTYEFYKTYDVDFIKTMNNGMYPIEDFGCEIDYSEIAKGGVAKVTKTPVKEAADWLKLTQPHNDGRQDFRQDDADPYQGRPGRACKEGAGYYYRNNHGSDCRGHPPWRRRRIFRFPDEFL